MSYWESKMLQLVYLFHQIPLIAVDICRTMFSAAILIVAYVSDYFNQQIEERIEEITQEEFTDEDNNNQVKTNKRNRLRKQYSSVGEEPNEKIYVTTPKDTTPDLDFLNAWDLVKSHRVAFPEFGVDLVDDALEYSDQEIEDEAQEHDVGTRHSYITAWEENWLFRKKKLFPNGGLRYQLMGFFGEPPCLLIPNSQEGLTQAQIDCRDVDQLSDLSEKNSIGSLEFSDTDESDSDQIAPGESEELVRLAQSVARHFSGPTDLTDGHLNEIVIQEGYPTKPVKTNNANNNTTPKKQHSLLPEVVTIPFPKFVPKQQRIQCNDPNFTSIPDDLNIHAGKVAQFVCQATSTQPIGVVWFRKGDLLGDGGRFQIHHQPNRGRYTLNIYDTDTDDTGLYSCVAYNAKGSQQWVDFSLKVKPTTRANCPPEFVVPLRVVSSVAGLTARLTCTLAGYPEPRVVFFHNRKQLTFSEKTLIENVGYGEWVMDIGDLSSSDEGGYEVVASNRLGHAVSTVMHRLGEITHPDQEKRKESRNEVKGIPETRKPTFNNESTEFSQPVNLSCPPKPGSIAEREHRKWENAAPIANNPYSRENVIKKRLERRISDISLTDPALTFQEFSKQRDLDESLTGRNGLGKNRDNEYARYQRDYYVNNNNSGKPKVVNGVRKNQPKEVITSLEEQVYASASQLLSLEDHVHDLVRQVQSPSHDLTGDKVAELESRVAQVFAQVENSSNYVSKVESEIEKLQRKRDYVRKSSVCSSSESSSTHANGNGTNKISGSSMSVSSDNDDEFNAPLPSVKKLANLFVMPSSTGQANRKNNPLNPTLHDDKKVIIIDSSSPVSSLNVPCSLPTQHVSSYTMSPKFQVVQNGKDPIRQQQFSSSSAESCNRPPPSLPVVKMLSRQFTNSELAGSSVQRVHSLTARSLSKEFRQLSQKHMPRPMNRTLSLTSNSSQPTSLETDRSSSPTNILVGEGHDSSPSPMPYSLNNSTGNLTSPGGGYTSDESSATSNPSSSLPRQRNKRNSMSKAILQRASYWERRAEQGLLSDNSVSEEFPSVEEQKLKLQQS